MICISYIHTDIVLEHLNARMQRSIMCYAKAAGKVRLAAVARLVTTYYNTISIPRCSV